MAIVFRTDASVSSGGFMVTYSSDEPVGELFSKKTYKLKNYLQFFLPIIQFKCQSF